MIHQTIVPVPFTRASHPFTIVAIPASNEEARIESCLAALAAQRTAYGAPIAAAGFEILIYANNCTDGTADIARIAALCMPQSVIVLSEALVPASAGLARKRAMDLAAERLTALGHADGLILTTDSDSCVSPTWISATWDAFEQGADCVAGYIDGQPVELLALGRSFIARGRAEDTYLARMAELQSLCDPKSHDPWPNHRVSSGASLAVTLHAYEAIGGLPALQVGEDAALTSALERRGFKVRHSMDVVVTTSCRLDGRAEGGAADTMRHRHDTPDAPCDDDLEPAFAAARRFLWRRALRLSTTDKGVGSTAWADRLKIPRDEMHGLAVTRRSAGFEAFWQAVQEASPVLRRGQSLRPSDLPREIARADLIIRAMRSAPQLPARTAPGDRSRHAAGFALAIA